MAEYRATHRNCLLPRHLCLTLYYNSLGKMFNNFKKCQRLVYFANFLVEHNKKLKSISRSMTFFINYSSQTRLFSVFQNRNILVTNDHSHMIISRNKSRNKQKTRRSYDDKDSSDEEEDDDFDEDEDEFVGGEGELKTINVHSLRADSILKNVLGISRKKIEEDFYSNKIRLNGNILPKKSISVNEGDELDLIKKFEDRSSNTLNIGRVKILKLKIDSENNTYKIKVVRSKSMIVNNYEGSNSYGEPEESS